VQRFGRDRDDCSHRAPERNAIVDADTDADSDADTDALAVTELLSESADRERFAQPARLL
jgi:hypothetical protein